VTGGAPDADQASLTASGEALQRAGRLTSFLTRAITELTSKPQGTEPMANTTLPPNTPSAPIKKSITGASFLGQSYKDDLAAAKAAVLDAQQQIGSAMTDLKSTAAKAIETAKTLQAEADDLKAALGQGSNEV
jgi:hypothetical protein